MKKTAIIVACTLALLATVASALSPKPSNRDMNQTNTKADSEGHFLTDLWKKLSDARKSDKPALRKSICNQIITEASRRHLTKDFYDAHKEYYETSVSVNWKERDTLLSKMESAIKEYDPVFLYKFWLLDNGYNGYRRDDSWIERIADLISADAEELRKTTNKAFYGDGQESLQNLIVSKSANDLEFLLWKTVTGSGFSEDTKASAMLEKELGTTYPSAAYLEYMKLDRTDGRDSLKAFAHKYEGKAISVYAKSDLLRLRLRELERGKVQNQADYKALRDSVKALIQEIASYKGDEAELASYCLEPENIAGQLDGKSIEVWTDDGKIKVALRNIASCTVEVSQSSGKSKKILLGKELQNTKRSYYVYDTLSVDLPALEDGDYIIAAKYGKYSTTNRYAKYSLSLAARLVDGAVWAYVTDWKSGKPYGKADFELSYYNDRNGQKLSNAVLGEGFTKLGFSVITSRRRPVLEAKIRTEDGHVLLSREVSLDYQATNADKNEACPMGRIFTDRGAYNPGDTVKFKALLCQNGGWSRSMVLGNADVKISLFDAESKMLASKTLRTNEMGSVSGEFVLPEDSRNGMFWLNLEYKGDEWDTADIRVDEYVLPTFDLEFDPDKKMHFPGDRLKVSGHVYSYSGHTLGGSHLDVKITSSMGRTVENPEVDYDDSGRFSIEFPSDSTGIGTYVVEVIVVDSTGETHSFNTSVMVTESLHLNVSLTNQASAQVELMEADEEEMPGYSYNVRRAGGYSYPYGSTSRSVLNADVAEFQVNAGWSWYQRNGLEVPVAYVVRNAAGGEVAKGDVAADGSLRLDVSSLASGLYTASFHASVKGDGGKTAEADATVEFSKISDTDTALSGPVRSLFMLSAEEVHKGEDFTFTFASSEGPSWVVLELFDGKRHLLKSKLLYISGITKNEDGTDKVGQTIVRETFHYDESYPDDGLCLSAVMFKNGDYTDFVRNITCTGEARGLKLDVASFRDKTLPGTSYRLVIESEPGAEGLLSVFDKSLDAINGNVWNTLDLSEFYPDMVWTSHKAGCDGSSPMYDMMFGPVRKMSATRSYGAGAPMALEEMVVEDALEVVETQGVNAKADAGVAAEAASVKVRSDFADALAFEPHISFDKDGKAEVVFTTSDKLSTYYVQLFSHTRDVRTAVLRKELVVNVPVKVSVAEPKYLYSGDCYVLAASVVSQAEEALDGDIVVLLYDGEEYEHLEPYRTFTSHVNLKAGGSVSESFEIDVPVVDATRTLGVKVVFTGRNSDGGKVSDGIFVPIEIYPERQTLTESHSAVLKSGEDKGALIAGLRKAFVNVSGDDAEVGESDIWKMVLATIPDRIESDGKDVLSLVQSYYLVNKVLQFKAEGFDGMASEGRKSVVWSENPRVQKTFETVTPALSAELLGKVLECRNTDGGFAWFPGMQSSPLITAAVLKSLADMPDSACGAKLMSVNKLASSVKYLDKDVCTQFARTWARSRKSSAVYSRYWYRWGFLGISMAEYLYIRSFYPSVSFDFKASVDMSDGLARDVNMGKCEKDFYKSVKAYLLPANARGLNGQILDKARRTATLLNFDEDAVALLRSLAGASASVKDAEASAKADVASLIEYKVAHKSGGVYYPNAVMPFRGLLETEAYAHALICNLMEDFAARFPSSGNASAAREIAEGLRIWLMIQKETQNWEATADYMDVAHCILSGNREQLQSVKVVSLSKTFEAPFEGLKAAGNGMKIERVFYREVSDSELDKRSGLVKASDVMEGWCGGRTVKLVALKDGSELHVGDAVYAMYKVYSDENRSFVRVSAPREACLRPADQLSGYYGYTPYRVRFETSAYWITPSAYRDVKSERSDLYIDVLPEENTSYVEKFFVTQEGVFKAPVLTAESLYAPHYRANDAFFGPVTAVK